MKAAVRGALAAFALLIFSGLGEGSDAVRLCAVGDILLDRDVRQAIEERGLHYPFKNVTDALGACDLAFGNLESVLAESGTPALKKYIFRGEPSYATALKDAGFNVISIANNHSLDWGEDAFNSSRMTLIENGLYPIGGGENQHEALSPVIVERKGFRFAFIGFLDVPPDYAPAESVGPALADIESFIRTITETRNEVDFIIVSIHWGIENTVVSTAEQVELAHRLIDEGADIILGHHPHVLQGIELYKGRPIVYSLGNFLFDNRDKAQRQSMMFGCTFEQGKAISPYFVPVMIENLQPTIARGKQYSEIADMVRKNSLQFNTSFKEDDGKVLVKASSAEGKSDNAIARYEAGGLMLDVYHDRVLLLDTSGRTLDSLEIKDASRFIKESTMILDGDVAHLYVIFGRVAEREGGRIGVIPVDLTEQRIETPFIDSHGDYNPWKIVPCDVDGDGRSEICTGVWKKTRYDKRYDNRLFVYNRKGDYLYPKWLGSRLAAPFLDFRFRDLDGDDIDELITLETLGDGRKRVTSYKWNGFGFTGDKVIATETDIEDLTKFAY